MNATLPHKITDRFCAALACALSQGADEETALEVAREVSAKPMKLSAAFDASKHPRGQPQNKGEFGPGGGGQQAAPRPQAPAKAPADAAAPDPAADYAKNGTRAKAFKAWFGEWEHDPAHASKVVNAAGEPQPTHDIPGTGSRVMKDGKPVSVYHGTAHGGFDSFNKAKQDDKSLYGPGFYFTENEGVAKQYTAKDAPASANPEVKSVYLNIRKPFDIDKDKLTAKQIGLKKFYPDEVRGSNAPDLANADGATMDTPMSFEFWRSYAHATGDIGQMDEDGDKVTGVAKQLTDVIRGLGHDGLTHIGGGRMGGGGTMHRVWIAFEPPQIKSVQNKGTFDPAQDSIALSAQWDEKKHKRGQPENAGEFGPGGGGAKTAPTKAHAAPSSGKPAAKAPSPSSAPHAAQPKPSKPQPQPTPAGDHREQQYVERAMKNLKATSRTASGTVDTSASPGKAGQMAAGLTGDKAADLATHNFEGVIRDLYKLKDNDFSSPQKCLKLSDDVNAKLNHGITAPGVLLRKEDSTKFPYTKMADLPAARQQFAHEFAQRMSDPKADPIETAAWVEWRTNIDHAYADGVGKTQRALAAVPLMRANLPLPNYPDPKKWFKLMPKEPIHDAAGDGKAYLGPEWEKYLTAYRMKNPAWGTRAVRHIEKHFPPANSEGVDALERHQKPDGTFTPQRAALHGSIDKKLRSGVNPSQDKTYHIMGGGPASGKSSVIKMGLVKLPGGQGGHVMIDSDAIKGELPEMQALRAQNDMRGADYVHEESSHVAKAVQAASFKDSQDVVLDGTGDSSIEAVEKKCKAARAAGYKVNASYTTCSTKEALRRNIIRAFGGEKAKAMGYDVNEREMKQKPEGRLPPEDMLRAVHQGVSTVLPEAVKRGLFDNVTLYDTEHKDAKGQPTLVMSAQGGTMTVHHPEHWQAFLDKANPGAVALSAGYDPEKHPHKGKGTADGGQFLEKHRSDKSRARLEKHLAKIHDEIDASNIPDETKARYKVAAREALEAIPAEGINRLRSYAKSYTFYESPDDVSNAHLAAGGVGDALGFYDPKTGAVHINGPDPYTPLAELFGHEMAHAINGMEDTPKLSEGKEWLDAFEAELKSPPLLGVNAASGAHEGWAEFGAHLFGRPDWHDTLESQCPRCMAFWRKKNLWWPKNDTSQ